MKCTLLFLLAALVNAPTAFAQRNLACPKPAKQKNYYPKTEFVDYLSANAYLTYPIAYKQQGATDNSFVSPAALIGYAVNLQNHFVLSHRVEWITEAAFAVNEYGIMLEGSGGRYYSSRAQYRFGTGISYNLSPKTSISMLPSAVYNTHYGYTTNTSSAGAANNTQNFIATVKMPDANLWMLGASLHLRTNVVKRFYLSFISMIDFAPTGSLRADIYTVSNGVSTQQTVDRKSYLLQLGLGVGYRLLQVRRRAY